MTLDRLYEHTAYRSPAPRDADVRPTFHEPGAAGAFAAAMPGVGERPMLLDGMRRLAMRAVTWLERRAGRRRLQSLNDHMLRDMGLSRREVEREMPTRWAGK
jgi:uncharacterized protein YjiS (DUF1127 family)